MTVPLSAFGLASPVPLWEAVFLTLLSYGVGVLGGIVGLALGTMRLPFLLLLGMPAPVAAGGNLVIGFLMRAFGWVGHVARGQVDYPLLALMALTGMGGTWQGARLTGKMNLRGLLALMGLVLLVVGGLLVWDATRR